MPQMARVRAASTGWSGGPGLNTFYFCQEGGSGIFNQSDAELCVDRVRGAFAAHLDMFYNLWQMTIAAEVDILEPTDGQLVNSFSAPPGATLVGAAAEGFEPLATTMLLRLNTSTFSDGSRIQGRAFIGPVNKIHEANGTPSSAYQVHVQGIGTELMDRGLSGPQLVVWRRPRVGSAGPPAVSSRAGSVGIVTSTSVPDKFAILRSRRD